MAERIIEFRHRRGWTQDALAKALKLSSRQVRRFEAGYPILPPMVRRIAVLMDQNDCPDLAGGLRQALKVERNVEPWERRLVECERRIRMLEQALWDMRGVA